MKDSIEFVFEKYYKRVGFNKEDTYCLLKKRNKEMEFGLLATNVMKKIS